MQALVNLVIQDVVLMSTIQRKELMENVECAEEIDLTLVYEDDSTQLREKTGSKIARPRVKRLIDFFLLIPMMQF